MTSVLTWHKNVSFLCKLFGLSENVFLLMFFIASAMELTFASLDRSYRAGENLTINSGWLAARSDNLYLYSWRKKIYLRNISTIRSPILCPFTSSHKSFFPPGKTLAEAQPSEKIFLLMR